MRGRPVYLAAWGESVGLIPAGAGQTVEGEVLGHPGQAHPRRCGADKALYTGVFYQRGSSPQVRGRHPQSWCGDAETGLIPAGAGQTFVGLCRIAWSGAHPRRCGADQSRNVCALMQAGSSPQVRGRRQHFTDGYLVLGLIPAGAGQTQLPASLEHGDGAHPRRCGADKS